MLAVSLQILAYNEHKQSIINGLTGESDELFVLMEKLLVSSAESSGISETSINNICDVLLTATVFFKSYLFIFGFSI